MAIGADLLALAQTTRRPGRDFEQRRFESATRSALVLPTASEEEDLWSEDASPKRSIVVRADAPLPDLAAMPTYFRSPFDVVLGQAPQPWLLSDALPQDASESPLPSPPLSLEVNSSSEELLPAAAPLETTTSNSNSSSTASTPASLPTEDTSSEDWALLRSWVELVSGLMRRREAKAASNEATARRALSLYLRAWRLDLWATVWGATIVARGHASSSSVVAATTSTVAMPQPASEPLDTRGGNASETAASESAPTQKEAAAGVDISSSSTTASVSGEFVADAVSNLLGKSFRAGPGRLRKARRLVFGSAPRLMQKLLRLGGDEAGLATRRFVHVALMATLAAQCVPMQPPPHPAVHPQVDAATAAPAAVTSPPGSNGTISSTNGTNEKTTGFRARLRRWIRPKSVARFYPRIGSRDNITKTADLHAPPTNEASQHNDSYAATPGNSQGSPIEHESTLAAAALGFDDDILSSSLRPQPSTDEWLRIELLARRGLGLGDNRKAHPLRLSLVQTTTVPTCGSALALVIVTPSRNAAVVVVRLAADAWSLLTTHGSATTEESPGSQAEDSSPSLPSSENGTVPATVARANTTPASLASSSALFGRQLGTVSEGARLVFEALESPYATTTTVTVSGDTGDSGRMDIVEEPKNRSGFNAVLRRASQEGDLKSVLFTGHGAGGGVATVAAAYYASLQSARSFHGGMPAEDAAESASDSTSTSAEESLHEQLDQKGRSRWMRWSVLKGRKSDDVGNGSSSEESTPPHTSDDKKKNKKKEKKEKKINPFQCMLVTVGAPPVGNAAFASLLDATVLPFGGLHLSSTGQQLEQTKLFHSHISCSSFREMNLFSKWHQAYLSQSQSRAYCGYALFITSFCIVMSIGDLTPAMGSALGYAASGANVELPFLPLGNATVAAPHLQSSVGDVTYSLESPSGVPE